MLLVQLVRAIQYVVHKTETGIMYVTNYGLKHSEI